MFRNPWIDPRVLQVTPAHADAYLQQHGWTPAEPYSRNLTAYVRSADDADGPTVYVPRIPDALEYPQRMIDLVAALSFAEDRYAVDVLSDILQARTTPTVGNGAAATPGVRKAVS